MGRASKEYCYSLMSNYKDKIDDKIYAINKNYSQMDLENADIQQEIADIATNMINICNQIKATIDSYYFE